jgi:hypothetical protein
MNDMYDIIYVTMLCIFFGRSLRTVDSILEVSENIVQHINISKMVYALM